MVPERVECVQSQENMLIEKKESLRRIFALNPWSRTRRGVISHDKSASW